nr:HDIG domain-containing protein [Leptospiraceae bacterium]
RAAQNLGLDWLLVRVGVYFHDIGKIPNAGFFVENQHLIPKKEHIDRNNPGLAAKIVIDHVLDGIEMAKKARLPREVISFIPEHHGTSTMAFFYHKALAELSPNQRKKIRKKDFQYPGPKPQRKETAIVMIADSVEAASRSLDTVSAESLEELIQKIIGTKLAENQLDECGLTLGDLNIIKNSFKEILLSSLHQRPKYPNTEETRKLEKENQTPVPVSRPKKAAQK